jgi:hypothetical protein
MNSCSFQDAFRNRRNDIAGNFYFHDPCSPEATASDIKLHLKGNLPSDIRFRRIHGIFFKIKTGDLRLPVI